MNCSGFTCRIRSLVVLLPLALVFSFVFSGLFETPGGSGLLALQEAEGAKGDDARIEEAMDRMKSAGRSFRRALRGKKTEDALAHAHKAQLATLESKDLVPDRVAEMEDPAARAESLKEYRLMIVATLEYWLKIERALLAGDLKTAGEEAKKISALKKSGHQKYRKEEDE